MGNKLIHRDKSWLEQKHIQEGLSLAEMGRLAGCKGDTIRKWLLKHNISVHTLNDEVEIDKEWLQYQYIEQEKTMREIAEIKDCSVAAVHGKLRKFGIPSRSNTEARKLYWKRNFVDRVGERYNSLTVTEYAGQTERQLHLWKCKCDCGNEVIVTYNSLNTGHTKSCGCIRNKYVPEIAMLHRLFSVYKTGARSRGLKFALSLEQFHHLTSQDCYYCGKSPSMVMHLDYNNGRYVYNSLDRLNNARGYTTENVVPSCKHCNMAKGKLSESDFLKWVIRVYEYQKKKTI